MMLGETHRPNPTVHVPPWAPEIFSPYTGNADYSPYSMQEALSALQHYESTDAESDSEVPSREPEVPVDAYSCDHFRMFEFKVRRCARGRSHDWTECPYAHPGEKARRRDPRKYHYSGSVCFFAHTPDQLRVLPQQSPRSADSYDGSPLRHAIESSCAKSHPFVASPGSASSPVESPPMSPMTVSVNEMVASLRNLQLGKVKSLPSSWNVMGSSGFGSPRGPMIRPGFFSLPTTPTQAPTRGGVNYFDQWDQSCCEEEPVMERVESGRSIRARMFEKLSKENHLDGSGSGSSQIGVPDVGWVSELVSR
ncbi:Zinc finger CCCH domain-containing protein 20 [Glycine soja]|nr:Zinc finger CCCH domain-containing protein 20 [Glycine soja]